PSGCRARAISRPRAPRAARESDIPPAGFTASAGAMEALAVSSRAVSLSGCSCAFIATGEARGMARSSQPAQANSAAYSQGTVAAAMGGVLGSSAPATQLPAPWAQDRTALAREEVGGKRRFVVGFLGSFVAVLGAVLAGNILVDPFALAGSGIVPTAVEPDRSVKLDLLGHLKHGPQVPILGASRGRPAAPRFFPRPAWPPPL